MEGAKVQLSPEELNLMREAGWILTKNRVIEKIATGMGVLAVRMRDEVLRRQLPQEVFHSNYKVSRGEKYQGLPYLMLDYPRLFRNDEILAVRTFFWWGNYFSITLHTRGSHAQMLLSRLEGRADEFGSWLVAAVGSEWNHDVDDPAYRRLDSLETGELAHAFQGSGFIKLAQKTGLQQWEETSEILFGQFNRILDLVAP